MLLFSDFDDIALNELKVIATLGKGAFARVDLVHHVGELSQTFALKRVRKEYVVETSQQQHMLNERNIMMNCSNQFICR